MKTAPALGFRCRMSPTLLALAILVTMLAVVAAWMLRGPAWLHPVLAVLIAVYAGTALRNLAVPPVKSLLWRAEGGVELELRDGREVLGSVQAARIIGPLIVLTLRWPPRERAHLWLLPDNLDADIRRHLRVRLGAGSFASGNADSG